MKHLLVACICCIFIISCTKSDLNDSSVLSENLKGKVSPDVLQCGVGAGPGAITGAVGGAVTNSVTNAAEQLWDHFFGS